MIIVLLLSAILSCSRLIHYSVNSDKKLPDKTLVGLAALVSSLPMKHNPLYALDQDGRNIMHHCALNNRPESILLCLSLRFPHHVHACLNVRQQDKMGYTPLHLAAAYGHVVVVEKLLEVEAGRRSINDIDCLSRSPLHLAAINGRVAVVEVLLKHEDLYIDKKNYFVSSGLDMAAANGHIAVVKALLKHASINAHTIDSVGRTVLHWATSNGYVAVVKALLSGALLSDLEDIEVNIRDRSGQTPLHLAAANGHAAIVEVLFQDGRVKPDMEDYSGKTPLSLALQKRHKAVVRSFVQNRMGVLYKGRSLLLSLSCISIK